MNAIGLASDVRTILHESGHAFHNLNAFYCPMPNSASRLEFAEVASMAMELLASPYLDAEPEGFYSPRRRALPSRSTGEHPGFLALHGSGGRLPALGLHHAKRQPKRGVRRAMARAVGRFLPG